MMLAHPQIDTVFDFEKSQVNTLVIENPAFFREFLFDIHAQCKGDAGKGILSRNYEPVDFAGNAELIDSFLSFDINRKGLLTKLLSRMDSLAMDESHYLRTSALVGSLEQYLQELSFDLPCDIVCGKLNFSTIIRAVGIHVPDDYESDLERLLDYMQISRELERDKLFIFVNLRSYYSDEEVQAFFVSAISHEYRIFLVDSVSRVRLSNECRVTVDCDLCEF